MVINDVAPCIEACGCTASDNSDYNDDSDDSDDNDNNDDSTEHTNLTIRKPTGTSTKFINRCPGCRYDMGFQWPSQYCSRSCMYRNI